MDTTRLSSKGQVIIPKACRDKHQWAPGLELTVIDTGDGLLLKPKAPFPATSLADVAGMFAGQVARRSDADIAAALARDVQQKWHGRG
ncbi:AbrB/MazE/SpoVT family DNA-binding domain-containing protein [Nevskia sp.]|uniref:AbrB/MazE/SpoVT family DNA-binding domain-containing protein n=1 Tax=Nevskia sp. TaxID=1929292 RepID=UPI0025E674CE|nr:AbrB/MazE/SpoVT family DNA-binding domain-containing protein [Nevskia sp.]